jgi:transposase
MTGQTQLVRFQGNLNAARYIEEILTPYVLPVMENPIAIFQQDNARSHTTRATMRFLEDNDIEVLEWPSQSPDINPIEHLWDESDRRVRRCAAPPETLDALAQALQEEWTAIPEELIQNLIGSMGRRCQAVIDSNGGLHNIKTCTNSIKPYGKKCAFAKLFWFSIDR